MLPKMCRKLPCRNIEVKTVSQVAGCGGRRCRSTPGWPWQSDGAADARRASAGEIRSQWLAGVGELVGDRAVAHDRTLVVGPPKKLPPWRIASR